ncbi:MAG: hypothetical protein AAB293_01000 [Pseudomonadota bacterium]
MKADKKNYLTVVAIVAVIGIISTFVNPLPVLGIDFKDVSVVNTPNVNAQQSGPWSVNVNNPAENPVLVRSVDAAPAKQPFQMSFVFNFGTEDGFVDQMFSVPSDYRLVIEWISATQTVGHGVGGGLNIIARFSGSGMFIPFLTSITPAQDGNDTITTAQKTLIYVDPGSEVTITMSRTAASGSQFGSAVISGYLEAVN